MKKEPKTRIRAVLFDLGKVIFDFNFTPAFRHLAQFTPLGAKAIEDFFWRSGLEVLYDGGKISSFQFYKMVKKDLGHTLSFREFKGVWNNIFTPNKEVVALIRRLGPRIRLVLISNTNAMHYEYLVKKYSVMDCFDRRIVSFKEKRRKPDEGIYRTAAKACKAKPREILYIDDRADLTEAAREIGFNTFTFKNNPTDLLKTMKGFEIL
ncbi:MAG: hypothetical protein COT00_05020 [Candidatus Omnitrophica bacterium CG07_land_8_20_14_0_80_50_8]|nr:MAG: hypothetical protein AUJ71_04390 [Candidatus Omnitrophica bacterium CG1_02_49_16]PIU39812.1 MAG: hypothetical protein COT00_05020 [Candidatus Omnitrophica bacterium CG07_land_8_20_14_0_80_50_8]